MKASNHFMQVAYPQQILFYKTKKETNILKMYNSCALCDSYNHVQWNLDTASLDTALILLLSQFLIMPDFFPSLSLLIKPQYSVIFTTSILLQHQFFCKPKTFFSYIFQPRYNINLKNGIFTIDKRKW